MIITQSGLTIRLSVSNMRIIGRAAQGVRLINLKEGDKIASVAIVPAADEPDELPESTEGGEPIGDDQSNNAETNE